ncbi:MAG: porin, partial [Rhodobacteraceae bacterium]|nr:porin [Paracoccaceae bacterium]
MKKFMISASALALSGSMAFAMDEDAMDEAMMMEAPAPSVTLGGSGELGFKHVDDGDDATEDIQLIREYKVSFSSSSTTDGGLVFGAGISIEDTHDNDPDKSVKGSNVFIGAADGTWRLKFGGNDPGIEKAGGIGVADGDGFHYGGDDTTIGFE